jgi:myosin protein heavy chain
MAEKVHTQLSLAKEHQVSELASKMTEVMDELREVKRYTSKAAQGVDTCDQVMTALKTAKSAGDLRCAIRRAEETQLPASDFQCFREQLLPEMERAEQDKAAAAENRRVEEKRRLETQATSEKKMLERKISEANAKLSQRETEISQLKSQRESEVAHFKEELRKVENTMKTMSEESNALEKERSELQVRYDSLRQHSDQKSTELNDLKKQQSSLKEEAREALSQLQVYTSRDQQQAATIEALRVENKKLQEQASAAVAKHQQKVSKTEEENINFRQRLQKTEESCLVLGEKNYGLEVKLRKAQWSSTNPSPHEFVNMARKRESDDNLSQRVGDLMRKNSELHTVAEEYKARNEVLWKYLPSDKETHIRQDLEALRQSRTPVGTRIM